MIDRFKKYKYQVLNFVAKIALFQWNDLQISKMYQSYNIMKNINYFTCLESNSKIPARQTHSVKMEKRFHSLRQRYSNHEFCISIIWLGQRAAQFSITVFYAWHVTPRQCMCLIKQSHGTSLCHLEIFHKATDN